jgi:hypothetical protein
MQPQSPRPSDRIRLFGRASRTSRRALCAGLLGLAALVPVGSVAAAASPPALDVLQIQRLAYPGGFVPPEALAAMKSRLAPAMSPAAEKVSADALTRPPSTTVTTVADGMASEPVEATGRSVAPETSPEAERPGTAHGMRAMIAPSKAKPAGSSPMRRPAISMAHVRDLAGVYFQPESQSPVVGGSPLATTAPATEPTSAVVATGAGTQVSDPVAGVPSADVAEPRRQLAPAESPERQGVRTASMRPDAIRELAGVYAGHAPVQAAVSPRSPVAQVERPVDDVDRPGAPLAPAGQAAVSSRVQPAPAAPQPSPALSKPAESSGNGNPGYRALPQAQLDAVINVFAPELGN